MRNDDTALCPEGVVPEKWNHTVKEEINLVLCLFKERVPRVPRVPRVSTDFNSSDT